MVFIAKMTTKTLNHDNTDLSSVEMDFTAIASEILVKRAKEPQRGDESRRMRWGRIAREIGNELRNNGYDVVNAWEVFEGEGKFSIDVLLTTTKGECLFSLKPKF
jgi:hypothetical protein